MHQNNFFESDNESLYFDKEDRRLLAMINQEIDHTSSTSVEKQIFNTTLHPHGIQNLANSHQFRMAYAVINLLGKLNQSGTAEERLQALHVLYDEVLHSAQTTFRFNTARVLIQIMKEIVRSRGNQETQLQLIHDFRKVASGNPRIVRQFLSKNYLLEMPEEWNQKTFDDHVHDSNTQGRKNSTYLIMDAWVKGIRRLTVVYYNYVEPEVARELLKAAEIVGITVRIGLKLKAIFRGRYVEFLWTPRGFTGPEAFLEFLSDPDMMRFQTEGHLAEEWAKDQMYATLDRFNQVHAPEISRSLSLTLPHFEKNQFDEFLAGGQSSLLRVAEFIHRAIYPTLEARVDELKLALEKSDDKKRSEIERQLEQLDQLSPNLIYNQWIAPNQNPDIPSVETPLEDDRPSLLCMDIPTLVARLHELRVSQRLTLLLGGLDAKDVLEILWDAQGAVTHIELFNMREWLSGRLESIKEINELQSAINQQGSVLRLKPIIRNMRSELKLEGDLERKDKFTKILEKILTLQAFYAHEPLGSRIGTDSTSHLGTRYGMGIAVLDTLPNSVAKISKNNADFHPVNLPLEVKLSYQEKYKNVNCGNHFIRWIRSTLGLTHFGLSKKREWSAGLANATFSDQGNMITMGGLVSENSNGFSPLSNTEVKNEKPSHKAGYLNTALVNVLKISFGFIPAFITFMLTQDWWFLAWFGALIWFSITGIRNIIQALISGGLKKNMLLSWKQLVSWSRVSDSLMYTGISVVLLEGITRNIILSDILGITVDNSPLLVFSLIALANGIYISSHNIFRGFPKTAVIGNLFRSVLAIPVAMVYNATLAIILPILTGMPAELILVPAAAIVSKFASDTVAGIIESTADRRNNGRLRRWDYKSQISRLFDCYTQLEVAFPKKNVLEALLNPKDFIRLTGEQARKLEIKSILISLDLMYFWYYLPCAQEVLIDCIKHMSHEERLVFVRFQSVLTDYQEVSKLFLDGMLGDDFSQALSFYLNNYRDYVLKIEELCLKSEMK